MFKLSLKSNQSKHKKTLMSWLRSTASVNKIHKLNCCHIYAMILILSLLLSFKVYPFTFLNLRITPLLVFEFIIFYSTFFVSMSLVREKMKTQIAMSEKDDNL